MELMINEWMERELMNGMYHVVYAESSTEWWILYSCDEQGEAEEELINQSAEGGEGEYFIIDFNGERV